ncbi:MAG: hypothetical protein JXA97_06840 [Anaerolineales bacterium]|nr:hypothetical protein [Anaerolineales bacterium]
MFVWIKPYAASIQRNEDKYFPVYLLAICVLAYGLLIPLLGFYWDDWPMLWFLHALGPGGFDQVWAMDRPLVGMLFQLSTAIIGEVSWGWHVFALIARWVSLMAFWWALRELWPDRKQAARWVILLLAVYPGFQQQSIGVIYSHYFLVMAFVGVSWASMLAALHRNHAWMWFTSSIICGAFALYSMEFFLGLELMRPVVLWIGLKQYRNERPRVSTSGWYLAPFAALWILYLVWRTNSIGFHVYKPVLIESVREAPLLTLKQLAGTMITDVWQAAGEAWFRALVPLSISEFGRMATFVWLIVVGIAAFLTIGVLLLWDGSSAEPSQSKHRWASQAGLLGAGIILLGGWVFWIPGLNLELFFPWDRFTLSWMLGIALLWVSLIDTFLPGIWIKIPFLTLMIAAGVGAQFRYAVRYQRAWEAEQRFFWNLSWRIPDLEPGTVILANEIPLDFITDNSLTGALNLMYAGETTEGEMPFIVYDLNTRIDHGLTGLEAGIPIEHTYRATVFTGTTSQALMIFYAPPGCLRVVDQVLDDSSPTLPPLLHAAIHLSRLELINFGVDEPAMLSDILMGPEPDQSWCYYFERADLARQRGDWAQIVILGDAAFQLDDRPNQAEERIPFIEGYAHAGDFVRAEELTREAMDHSEGIRKPLCHAWDRIESSTDLGEAGRRIYEEMQSFLDCD